MQISHRKNNIEKTLKNRVREPLRLHLGWFGEAPGRHWGTPGRHVGVSWTLLVASWAPLWPHGCFGLDLGRGLGSSWGVLGGFGEYFGRILGRFWEDIFVSETPALPRQLAWRHNARGSRRPTSVLDYWHQGIPCLCGGAKLL